MTHQLGSPLPGSQHYDMDNDVEEVDGSRIPRNCPRIHPWCSVQGCTERPLRQFMASSSKQIIFMCKTHFGTVPNQTREGWKQYRGTRTFPETKIAAACRPGPNRGQGGAAAAAATTTTTATATTTNTTEGDPGYTNPVEEDKAVRGQTKNAMWPGKVYGALYEVWNAHAERKKMETGDSYITSVDRAELVPEAASILRERGQVDMANILDNTTEGARKVIHSRMLAKYLKNREAFSLKLRGMGFDPQEVADWEAALAAAQHHADLMPMRERETHQHQPHSISQEDPSQVGGGGGAAGGGGGGAGGGAGAGDGSGRSIYNGATPPRKKPGRKPKLELHHTPEAKRARALDSMVSAAERSNALQKGAAEAGAEHLRRLELADAERLGMEKEEHELRMAIGKSALALLNKMVHEASPQQQQGAPHGPMG